MTYGSCLSPLFFLISELKRRMKAEKKASEKDAKLKEQQEQKSESNDQQVLNASELDETLDPNVRFLFVMLLFVHYYIYTLNILVVLYKYNVLFPSVIAILQDPYPSHSGTEGHS